MNILQIDDVDFECGKTQKVPNYEMTREELLDYKELKERFGINIQSKEEEKQKSQFDGKPVTL